MKTTNNPNSQRKPKGVKAVGSSDVLGRAWDILKARGKMRGSDLGWELWGSTTECANRGTGSQRHNKFCRPAGKVLKRLQRLGCVLEVAEKTCMVWMACGTRPNDQKLSHAAGDFRQPETRSENCQA